MITQSFPKTGPLQSPVQPPPKLRWRRWLPATVLSLIFLTQGGMPTQASAQQQPDEDDPQGVEVLTRGPVHEAFAGVISNNVEPAAVIPKAPPEPIEEIPPDQRLAGDNVTWIPGYWAWDDERNDFLWISGIWRDVPPDREWRVGYWTEISGGWQWISGYWADLASAETTYLPAPPPTVEEGPNIEAPSNNYSWSPGHWAWREARYAWSPGYWAECRPDWDWNPPHYNWTPGGYVFVDGYWDHAISRRGVIFAPVYFDTGIRARPAYSWSPSIVISLGMVSRNLFVRPRYDHYYFGDYYDRRYSQQGFVSSFTWQSSRRGYDPFYARQRWEHRDDKDWDRNFRANFEKLRDDAQARPPRTWRDERLRFAGPGRDGRDDGNDRDHPRLVGRFADWVKRPDSNFRYQTIAQSDREQYQRLGKELQKSRIERRDIEGKQRGPGKDGQKEPFRAKAEKSLIIAKADRNGPGDRTPPPRPGNAQHPDPRGNRDGRDNSDSKVKDRPDKRGERDNKKDNPGPNIPPGPGNPRDPRAQDRDGQDGKADKERPDSRDRKDKDDEKDKDNSRKTDPRNPSPGDVQPDPRKVPNNKPDNRSPDRGGREKGEDGNKNKPDNRDNKRPDSKPKDADKPDRPQSDKSENSKPPEPRKDSGNSKDPHSSRDSNPRKEPDKSKQQKESKGDPASRPRQPDQKAGRGGSRPQPEARPKNDSQPKPRGESPKPQQKKESPPQQPKNNPQPKAQTPQPSANKPSAPDTRGGGKQKGRDGKDEGKSDGRKK